MTNRLLQEISKYLILHVSDCIFNCLKFVIVTIQFNSIYLASSVNLSWTEPSDNGGSSITGYFIEKRDYDLKGWFDVFLTTSDEKSSKVDNLFKGKRYSFRVSAENKFGRSEPIELAEPIIAKDPYDVPDKPINVVIKDITASNCIVNFEPPLNNGGSPIIGYIVERKQVQGTRWLRINREPIADTNILCDDLIEGLEYEVRVIAVNKAGESEPSEASKPFIAKNPFSKPGPPENLRIGEVTKSSIELLWSEPLNNGGAPIITYVVEKRSSKQIKWTPCDYDERSNKCHFNVEQLREGYEYEFRVAAKNKAGVGDFTHPTQPVVAKIKIVGNKPIILEPLKTTSVPLGLTAKLIVKYKASPVPEVKWYFNDRLINLNNDIVNIVDKETIELTIPSASVNHIGTYRVVLSNPLGEAECEGKLVVLKKPTISYDEKLNKNIEVVANEQNLHISCDISGYPKPAVTWLRAGLSIAEDGRARVDAGETYTIMHINKMKREEQGVYTLILENEAGKATAEFNVVGLFVPSPPLKLTVEDITGKSCKIKWNAPVDDGGTPITSYVVEKRDVKHVAYTRLDKTALLEFYADKLQKDQKYFFRVFAENKVGLSEPCELGEPMESKSKFSVPSAPQSLKVSNISKSSCFVSWSVPTSNGGLSIIGYFVERKCGSKWIRLNKTPVARVTYDVTDLQESNEYEFRVCAVNEEGESPFSKTSEMIIARNQFSKPEAPIFVETQNITKNSCLLLWR